jgi:hypothetical protein
VRAGARVCARVRVCVCARAGRGARVCVRARARACVRACVRARVCACVRVCVRGACQKLFLLRLASLQYSQYHAFALQLQGLNFNLILSL